ncbi:MAG: pilus assembly protein N-terminal domain-containing protein [Candidatus Eremiobacteraeota bacterium]|nr:pilus assembly protein N-terminal domain-containing protein [Candidatus Eremiobacteraeota bacterium]MBV8373213.1 pilus assembly protein N-terminal domain-containing protein [Candidatus Eremiobacteraeota bacterium]
MPAPNASPTPTSPPITIEPASAAVPIGSPVRITVGSVLAPIAATIADPAIADIAVDQTASTVTISGKKPGVTVVTISDSRRLTRDVPVRVAYYAGSAASQTTLSITGDPASADFVRQEVAAAVVRAASARPGAQVVVGPDDVPFNGNLAQDRVTVLTVPVLIQGTDYFEVDASTRVDVRNVATPRISPDSLMVSDYPERLEENGTLFTADLRSEQPSRFLYFHYNPPGQPARRVVLRADNHSSEPANVQFISGRGGPTANEMEVGHVATRAFLINVVQNQGRLITIPGNTSLNIAQQDLPPGTIVCNLLQLRVLSGSSSVHLTLFAQPVDADPAAAPDAGELLEATHKHARGIYPIPEFYYATQWNVNGDYLEVPIGQIPLPNDLQGQALSGDYGVLQSFVVTLHNPLGTPQSVALYENPRGGRATGTYLIDGQLVQSHQVPPFSRYKVRQYVIPARGFVRITIVTMPEAGSSYPLRLIFAPDDGSVPPGASGSPIY